MPHLKMRWIAVLPFLTWATLAQQAITFEFNPPAGTTFVETDRHTLRMQAGDTDPIEQIDETKTKYSISKTPAGYSVSMEPAEPPSKFSNDLQSLGRSVLSNLAITADLDQQGNLVRLRGIGEALAKVRQNLPKEVYDLAMQQFGGKTPQQIAAQAWNDRRMLGTLVGRTLKVDIPEKQRVRQPVPMGGTILADTTLTIKPLRPCQGHQCVLVRVMADSDDPNIAAGFKSLFSNLMLGLAAAMGSISPENDGTGSEPANVEQLVSMLQVLGVRYSAVSERLVDPMTGLLYSERATTTMEGIMRMAEEETKFTRTEIHEYSYSYQ
jgi:hypothetical protein